MNYCLSAETKDAMKRPAVYMMASRRNGTVYTGVTSNLVKRAYEHKHGLADGFTRQYSCKTLVFIEYHETMEFAILREKQIKGGSRKKKVELIEQTNSEWNDLYLALL